MFITVCLLSLFIFSSCSTKEPDSNLIIVKNGLICSIADGKPFTGKVSDSINMQTIEYDVVKGIKDGDFNVFTVNGKKVISGEIKNNKNEGLWQYFYLDGQLESQGYFNNDVVNDKWFWYYPDGKLKTEGNYIRGKKDGKWTSYSETGKIISEQVFRNDKIVAGMKEIFS